MPKDFVENINAKGTDFVSLLNNLITMYLEMVDIQNCCDLVTVCEDVNLILYNFLLFFLKIKY